MWGHNPALMVTVIALALLRQPALLPSSVAFSATAAQQQEQAQTADVDPAVGDWSGLLDADGGLRFIVHIRSKDGKLAGTCDSPDQNVLGVPLTTITREGDTLRFSVTIADLEYTGTIDGDRIVGKLSQRGRDFDLSLKRVSAGHEG